MGVTVATGLLDDRRTSIVESSTSSIQDAPSAKLRTCVQFMVLLLVLRVLVISQVPRAHDQYHTNNTVDANTILSGIQKVSLQVRFGTVFAL